MKDMKSLLKKVSNKLGDAVVELKKSSRVVIPSRSSSAPFVLSAGQPFASQVKGDRINVIRHDFDLGSEEVCLPKNCILWFQGGTLRNGMLVGNDSIIHADERIFDGVSVGGTWSCVGDVAWFADGTSVVNDQWGCRFPQLIDQSAALQLALDSSFRELHFPPKCYYIDKPIVLTKEKKLILHGSDMKLSCQQSGVGNMNTCVIFSDKDICLLRIAVRENWQNAVLIDGGNFDVSLCEHYTQNCIEVRADQEGQKIWGLTINTNVKGRFGQTSGVGININPVANYNLTDNNAYVTQIRINSNVSNFCIGVKATNYFNGSTCKYYNWCTDVEIGGSIINCPTAVSSNVEDLLISATMQSGRFWQTKDNGQALVCYSGLRVAISGSVYDIRMGSEGSWSNEYAMVTEKGATVSTYGKFESFRLACEKLGWPLILNEE